MRIFLIPIALTLLSTTSCKESTQERTIQQQEKLEESADFSYNNNWTQSMNLDKGEKWVANEATNNGVSKMKELLSTSSATTLEEYHDLASNLNLEKNILIKKCTMTDAAHDNLHTFLEPLIEKIAALAEVESTDEAVVIKETIRENLDLYSKYFK